MLKVIKHLQLKLHTNKTMKETLSNPLVWLVISLTLGLAPFSPEPHVWEKIKWVMAGAEGMRFVDWFDLILHGTPWIMLILTSLSKLHHK